jgi:hypothetical protein
VSVGSTALAGWSPVRLGWDGPRPVLDWCFTEGVAFTAPFFHQTVEECFRDHCRLLFQRRTGIEEAGRLVAEHPGLPPAAFIFHMSRCGSTLVAQMLVAVAEHLVLSEAGPVDSVLRAHWASAGVGDDDRVTWLRWIVGALGQPRHARQRRLYLKLDAWSVLDLEIVRQAYPDVPWFFLYRDPVEVLVSQSRRMGAHVIPGVLPPALLGMTPAQATGLAPVEYQARVLARICEAALDHSDDPRATFVEYRQLPGPAVTDLAPQADAAPMLRAATRDAKNPALPFEQDRSTKQAQASSAQRAAADRWLVPLYERLEGARARQEALRNEAHAAQSD